MLDWSFDCGGKSEQVQIAENGRSVLFHPTFSIGNAVCRGNTALRADCHHYWEFKLTQTIYGTAFMIGIGTEKVDMNQLKYSHSPFLGADKESWGYCHNGKIYHGGSERIYHGPNEVWQCGSVLGIHLDLWKGNLEFSLNGTSLGVAFTGIPRNVLLFPFISSTAAKSGLRLEMSKVLHDSLTYRCVKALGRMIRESSGKLTIEDFYLPPGLKSLIARNLGFLVKEPEQNVISEVPKETLTMQRISYVLKRGRELSMVKNKAWEE